MITGELLCKIVPTLSLEKAELYAPILESVFIEFEINTKERQACFIAQTAHESQNYSRFVENLNYSANGLMSTWPNRFPSYKFALVYARQPEKIANKVYADRLGNGSVESGDGWRYRGRSIIQTTGKENYKATGEAMGLDLVASPELLEIPEHAFRAAGVYWRKKNLNAYSDKRDFKGQTKAINGGFTGLAERLEIYNRAIMYLN